MTAVTMGAWLGISMLTSALVGAGLAIAAIGFDWQWLQISLAIIGFAVSAYSLTFGWQAAVQGWLEAGFVSAKTAAWLAEVSILWRLVAVAVNGFFTYATMIGIRDGITYSEALEQSAEDLGELVGGVIGGAVGGVFDALFGSPGGLILLAIGVYVGYKLLSSGSEDSGGEVNINQYQPEAR